MNWIYQHTAVLLLVLFHFHCERFESKRTKGNIINTGVIIRGPNLPVLCKTTGISKCCSTYILAL